MTAPRETVLVIDDEPQIRRFLRTGLGVHAVDVVEAGSAEEGLRLATTVRPDLVILDLGLPDGDGVEVLRRIREWSDVPVFVLSVRERESEKVRAIEAGADDYLTKPFGMAELLARMRRALSRRAGAGAAGPVLKVGELTIDLAHRLVTLAGRPTRLSPKQYRLLALLAANAGKVMTHAQLLREIWGPAHEADAHYLRIFVRKLRAQIEPQPERPRYLVTELGVGYRLRTPDQLGEAD